MGGWVVTQRKLVFIFLISFSVYSTKSYGESCASSLRKAATDRRAFTLTEVLVTGAAISVLVALSFPMLKGARESSRNVVCLSGLRQPLVSTQLYSNDNKEILPVDWINNSPGNPTAGVNLWNALQMDEADKKVMHCPSDRGFNLETGEEIVRSYVYYGIAAMFAPHPTPIFDPKRAVRRYEYEATWPRYWKIPVYFDARGFHESRQGPPDYWDGKYNAAWWDGSADRDPDRRPPGPQPPAMP